MKNQSFRVQSFVVTMEPSVTDNPTFVSESRVDEEMQKQMEEADPKGYLVLKYT